MSKLLKEDNLGSLRFILQIFTIVGATHQHIYIAGCTSSVYALLKYFYLFEVGILFVEYSFNVFEYKRYGT